MAALSDGNPLDQILYIGTRFPGVVGLPSNHEGKSMKTLLCIAAGGVLGVAGVLVLNKVRYGKFTLGGF